MKLVKIIFVLTLFSTAFAQSNDANKMSQSTAGSSQILSSNDDILGSEVMSSDGEKVGKVKEIIGDNSQSTVKYIVVSGSKLHPVPWSACTVSKTESESEMKESEDANENGKKKMSWSSWGKSESSVSLNISKDQFQRAPTVESMDIGQFTDLSLQRQVDNFYSSLSGTQSRSMLQSSQSTTNLFKVSDTIGMKVKDMQDENLGKVKDVVVDSTKGDLAFGLVGFKGTEGTEIAAVPWRSITINSEDKIAYLDATTDKLEAAVLEKGDISKLSQRQFANRIYEVFGEQPYWGVYGYEPSDSNKPDNEPNSSLNKGNDI